MDTVYLVTCGEYDDYQVISAYTIKEDAELVASMIHDAKVEDYPVDTEYLDLIHKHPGKKPIGVWVSTPQDIYTYWPSPSDWTIEPITYQSFKERPTYCLRVTGWFANEPEAMNIAKEIYQRMVNSGEL